ncbi:hypothetical protein QQP08_019121 [Theobroma cacao]|nr:hypothetical protein QQP08_019121 [Theobroma cacao]
MSGMLEVRNQASPAAFYIFFTSKHDSRRQNFPSKITSSCCKYAGDCLNIFEVPSPFSKTLQFMCTYQLGSHQEPAFLATNNFLRAPPSNLTWTFVVEHLDGQLTIKQKPGYENSSFAELCLIFGFLEA